MGDLFDYATARAAKKEAMGRVEINANPDWKAFMLRQVRLTCLKQKVFNSDDVFARAEADPNRPTTHDKRAFGPVMHKAARLGYCRPTGNHVKSLRTSNHTRPIEVWESLIFVGDHL